MDETCEVAYSLDHKRCFSPSAFFLLPASEPVISDCFIVGPRLCPFVVGPYSCPFQKSLVNFIVLVISRVSQRGPYGLLGILTANLGGHAKKMFPIK